MKTLVTIIVYPDFMWHYRHQNVSQWHRPRPISLRQSPRPAWCLAGGDPGWCQCWGSPHISRGVQGPQVRLGLSAIHPFLMRLAKKLWWKVLKLLQWKTSLTNVASWLWLPKFEYFMQGKYFMKAFSGLCNLSYMKNIASWALTWIYQRKPQKKLFITHLFISRLFLAAVSPVFQKTFYGSLGKLFFCWLRCHRYLRNYENFEILFVGTQEKILKIPNTSPQAFRMMLGRYIQTRFIAAVVKVVSFSQNISTIGTTICLFWNTTILNA